MSVLTSAQWRFLSHRLLCSSDSEAAQKTGIHVATPTNWKNICPDFAHEYEQIFIDSFQAAQTYSRQLMGKAVARLDEGLDATRDVRNLSGEVVATIPDHKTRLESAKLLLQTQGLLHERIDVVVRAKEAARAAGLDVDSVLREVEALVNAKS